jgi:hypothetical protein
MEPVVIDEAILGETHFNFIEYKPAPDSLVEVLCFQSGHNPINTFDKFRGKSDDERTNTAILLSHPVTKVSVVNGTAYSGPAIPDDGIVMVHEDDYNNIYWKYHTPAMLPIRRPKKTAAEPITPEKLKQPVTESPVSVMGHFGGKRTKRRKKRRKSRRK